jgi:hypothetical protein
MISRLLVRCLLVPLQRWFIYFVICFLEDPLTTKEGDQLLIE